MTFGDKLMMVGWIFGGLFVIGAVIWFAFGGGDDAAERRQVSRAQNLQREAVEITLSDGTVCVMAYGKLACGCTGGAKP